MIKQQQQSNNYKNRLIAQRVGATLPGVVRKVWGGDFELEPKWQEKAPNANIWGRIFCTGGMVSTFVLRQEQAEDVQGRAGKEVWLGHLLGGEIKEIGRLQVSEHLVRPQEGRWIVSWVQWEAIGRLDTEVWHEIICISRSFLGFREENEGSKSRNTHFSDKRVRRGSGRSLQMRWDTRTGPQNTSWRINRTCDELDVGRGRRSLLSLSFYTWGNRSPECLLPLPRAIQLAWVEGGFKQIFLSSHHFCSFHHTTPWLSGHIAGAGHFRLISQRVGTGRRLHSQVFPGAETLTPSPSS